MEITQFINDQKIGTGASAGFNKLG